jgi:hypothetical protein
MAVTLSEVARRLRELIAALDRRVPRAEHAAEVAIARDAAALRETAVNRLAEVADHTVSAPDGLVSRSAESDADDDRPSS